MLRGTQGYCAMVGELKGDFGVPGCDELDGDGSEVCRCSENSAKLVSFGIRGSVK